MVGWFEKRHNLTYVGVMLSFPKYNALFFSKPKQNGVRLTFKVILLSGNVPEKNILFITLHVNIVGSDRKRTPLFDILTPMGSSLKCVVSCVVH